MRRRRSRRLLICLVLLAALLVAADEVVTAVAESQLASRARVATRAASANVSMGPFPVLAYLFGEGRVPEVSVTLNDVLFAVTRITFGRVRNVPAKRLVVDLHNVSISRADLLQHQKLDVTAIGSAAASLTITASDLSTMVGLPVGLPGDGLIDVRIAGVTVTGSLAVAPGNLLVLSAEGKRLASIDLRSGRFLSQCPVAIAFNPGKLVASCTMSPVPRSLIKAVLGAGATGQQR